MYLKTLAVLGGGDGPVPAAAVAERLGVTPVAVNEMLRRLATQGLVEHEQRHGFRLTGQGRTTAWDVVRRQRVWERFLVDRLELDPSDAMSWACLLEHATAPEVLNALDAFLGLPATCPEGQPIPRSPADPVRQAAPSVADRAVGESIALVGFDDTDAEVLAYLRSGGLEVGAVVRIGAVGPRRSLFTIEGPTGSIVLAREIAATVQAIPVAPASGRGEPAHETQDIDEAGS
jgi:DtxR family transcriptional regulator, Mn-dependent transcriptional regulator